MSLHKANSRMLGTIGLHDHPARTFAAPCPAGHLVHDLKCALGGAKIGKMDCLIGLQNTDQGHAAEIVSFGYHLCSHQNVDFPSVHAIEKSREPLSAVCAVAIETRHTGSGKTLPKNGFYALGSSAHPLDRLRLTCRTNLMNALGAPTVVTKQCFARSMERQRHRAVRATQNVAAGSTMEEGRETPTIEKQNRLLARNYSLLHGDR